MDEVDPVFQATFASAVREHWERLEEIRHQVALEAERRWSPWGYRTTGRRLAAIELAMWIAEQLIDKPSELPRSDDANYVP